MLPKNAKMYCDPWLEVKVDFGDYGMSFLVLASNRQNQHD
jgi:hypothetical protein